MLVLFGSSAVVPCGVGPEALRPDWSGGLAACAVTRAAPFRRCYSIVKLWDQGTNVRPRLLIKRPLGPSPITQPIPEGETVDRLIGPKQLP